MDCALKRKALKVKSVRCHRCRRYIIKEVRVERWRLLKVRYKRWYCFCFIDSMYD